MQLVLALMPFLFLTALDIRADDSAETLQPAGPSIRSVFVRREIVPGQEVKIRFKVPQCIEDSIHPKIETYTSELQLPSVESGKLASVRGIHMYLFANNLKCSLVSKKVNQNVEIESVLRVDSKRMTHLFLTLSDGISYTFVTRVAPELTK